VRVDMAGVARRKRTMVQGLVEVHLANFGASGVELVMGEARFTDPKTVQVTLDSGGTRSLRGERVFINVGTRATMPDVPGLANTRPMTHVEALNLERVPGHLVILGGGYVGLEFAQAMRRFGSHVTVIQRGPRLLEREDQDVSDALQELLTDEGVEVLIQSDVLGVSGISGRDVSLRVRAGTTEKTIEASDILVAVGRTPNTDRLDLTRTGVELDSRGYIRVNERLETTSPDVWAMGECAGSPQFTHVGEDDFRVVLDNLNGGKRTTRGRLIPYCLFTDPELAHVGMSESEARAKGVSYRIARMPMARVFRAMTLSQTRGFVKALIGDDDRILGFTAFGAEASEMMAVAQTAMLAGIPYTVLRDAIWTHPTTAEGLIGLFLNPPLPPEP
jgi:pyruvate/2-oxoglutarate dehydrogenase complex dihydrolipoamide dehydrogenase (E3) component